MSKVALTPWCALQRNVVSTSILNYRVIPLEGIMLLRVVVIASIVLVSLCPGESEGEARKLQIGVKKRPEECPIKSKPGDKVQMHYKVSQYS